MLFRAQSLWLLLTAIFAFLTYKFPFYHGIIVKNNIIHAVTLKASFNYLILFFTGLLSMGSFFLIFLYRDRSLQWLLTMGALMVAILNIIIYFTLIQQFEDGSGDPSLTAILSFAIPFFLLMAARCIRNDEKIIQRAGKL